MTIGDVLAVVFFVIGLWISTWALLVGVALLFPARATGCQTLLAQRPWRALITGAILVATAGLVAIMLLRQPNGLGKLLGWAGLAALLGIAALGASGLSLLLGERLAHQQPDASKWSTLARGAGLLVVSGIVPLLGWFGVVPLSIVASLGAGWLSLWKRTAQPPDNSAAVATETIDRAPWPAQSTLAPQSSSATPPVFSPNGATSSPELASSEALQ